MSTLASGCWDSGTPMASLANADELGGVLLDAVVPEYGLGDVHDLSPGTLIHPRSRDLGFLDGDGVLHAAVLPLVEVDLI